MKTLEQIKQERNSKFFNAFYMSKLSKFVPEEELEDFGLELRPENKGKHVAVPFTREAVIEELRELVEYGFIKAIDQRGMSSSMAADGVVF